MNNNEKQERTRVFLSSEKTCIEFAKMYIAEGFAVRVGKEKDTNSKRSKFFFEYWKES